MVAQKSSIQTYYYVTTLDLMSFLKRKKIYCGAKGSGDSDPFDIKPKAHAEEEEVPEDE